MPPLNLEQIRNTLREEVPEFKQPGGVVGFLGHLFMLIGSIGLACVVGLGLFWFIAYSFEMDDLEDSTYFAVMVISPVLGLIVGYLTRDSITLSDRGRSRHGDHEAVGFGCLLFFLHMVGSSVYYSVTKVFQGTGKDHSKEFELAVSIVCHLLRHGETPTATLADSLAEQGVPRERTRDTLALLRAQLVIEPTQESTKLSPSLQTRLV